jgi:DNA invertase Pin-like site-specific DNA recombinase
MRAILYDIGPGNEQLDTLRAYAKAYGLEVLAEYIGTHRLPAVIEVAGKRAALLVVTRLERLAPPLKAVEALKRLHAEGGQFAAIKERIDTSAPGDTFWTTIPMIERLANATHEVRREIREKRKAPKGKAPFGYNLDRTRNEDEQAIIAEAKRLVDGGLSYRGACRVLDERGLLHRGKSWAKSASWLGSLIRAESPEC